MKAHKIIGSKQNPSRSKNHQPTGKLKLVSKASAGPNIALDVYLQSLAPSGRKSMRSLLSTVGKILMAEQPGSVVWHKINYQKIQRVRAVLVEQGRSVNTINLALAGIRGVARAAFNMALMDSDTWMRLQAVKRVKGMTLQKGRSLTSKEIESMIEVCSKRKAGVRGARDKALLLVGCYAGLRSAELTALKISDFNTQTGSLKIINGKGRKQRELYLSPDVVDAINQWIICIPKDSGDILFRPVSKGDKVGKKYLSEWGVAVILRQLQVRSKVAAFSPHDMRRSFITRLLESNVDLSTIQKLVAHESIFTTASYDRRDHKELRNASRNINK